MAASVELGQTRTDPAPAPLHDVEPAVVRWHAVNISTSPSSQTHVRAQSRSVDGTVEKPKAPSPPILRDYHIDFLRLSKLIALAMFIAFLCTVAGLATLSLIGFITNGLFFQRLSAKVVSIEGHTAGAGVFFIPIAGSILVGLIARFGTDKIRGHGLPEVLQLIVYNRARVKPLVALLKPLATAICIGTGNPFGAEGVIIMTGGGIGSIVSQFFQLPDVDRKTLLIAGASGGMTAVFGTPISALFLGIEVLLLDTNPLALVPVVFSAATAMVLRPFIVESEPLFTVPDAASFLMWWEVLLCVVLGVIVAVFATALTHLVHLFEDGFTWVQKHAIKQLHWMWWPALGSIVVGIVGLFFPAALGPGYGNITRLITGEASMSWSVELLLLKSLIWTLMLGTNTSGGLYAPFLNIGAALGRWFAAALVASQSAVWCQLGMSAMMSAFLNAPVTGFTFTLEVTRNAAVFMPSMLTCAVAHCTCALLLRRSMLTEPMQRRGAHLNREPPRQLLDTLRAKDVMVPVQQVLKQSVTVSQALHLMTRPQPDVAAPPACKSTELVCAVLDGAGVCVALATPTLLQQLHASEANTELGVALQSATDPLECANPNETAADLARRMLRSGLTRVCVVGADGALQGIVTRESILTASLTADSAHFVDCSRPLTLDNPAARCA